MANDTLSAALEYFTNKLLVDSEKVKMSMDDILGYDDIKMEIEDTILFPKKMSCVFPKIKPILSLILFGPPGCGKTIFCEALAYALDFQMMIISGADIQDKHLGANVIRMKAAFEVAMRVGNCMIFFGTKF